jgi:hypothetical protein
VPSYALHDTKYTGDSSLFTAMATTPRVTEVSTATATKAATQPTSAATPGQAQTKAVGECWWEQCLGPNAQNPAPARDARKALLKTDELAMALAQTHGEAATARPSLYNGGPKQLPKAPPLTWDAKTRRGGQLHPMEDQPGGTLYVASATAGDSRGQFMTVHVFDPRQQHESPIPEPDLVAQLQQRYQGPVDIVYHTTPPTADGESAARAAQILHDIMLHPTTPLVQFGRRRYEVAGPALAALAAEDAAASTPLNCTPLQAEWEPAGTIPARKGEGWKLVASVKVAAMFKKNTATPPRQASKAKGGHQEDHRFQPGDRIKARYSSKTHTLADDGPPDALHNAEIVGQRQHGKYRIQYLDGDIQGDLATLPANQIYKGLSSDSDTTQPALSSDYSPNSSEAEEWALLHEEAKSRRKAQGEEADTASDTDDKSGSQSDSDAQTLPDRGQWEEEGHGGRLRTGGLRATADSPQPVHTSTQGAGTATTPHGEGGHQP